MINKTAIAILSLAAATSLSHAAVVFSVQKVATQNGFDIYDIDVVALSGADATAGPNGFGVQSVNITFTATNGAFLTPGKTEGAAQSNTLNVGGDPLSAAGSSSVAANYVGTSYLNMDFVLNFTRTGPNATLANQHLNTSSSFSGNYGVITAGERYIGPSSLGSYAGANGDSSLFEPDSPLFAELILTAGSGGQFTGTVITSGGNTLHISPISINSDDVVPEPTSLCLLFTPFLLHRRRQSR